MMKKNTKKHIAWFVLFVIIAIAVIIYYPRFFLQKSIIPLSSAPKVEDTATSLTTEQKPQNDTDDALDNPILENTEQTPEQAEPLESAPVEPTAVDAEPAETIAPLKPVTLPAQIAPVEPTAVDAEPAETIAPLKPVTLPAQIAPVEPTAVDAEPAETIVPLKPVTLPAQIAPVEPTAIQSKPVEPAPEKIEQTGQPLELPEIAPNFRTMTAEQKQDIIDQARRDAIASALAAGQNQQQAENFGDIAVEIATKAIERPVQIEVAQ